MWLLGNAFEPQSAEKVKGQSLGLKNCFLQLETLKPQINEHSFRIMLT